MSALAKAENRDDDDGSGDVGGMWGLDTLACDPANHGHVNTPKIVAAAVNAAGNGATTGLKEAGLDVLWNPCVC